MLSSSGKKKAKPPGIQPYAKNPVNARQKWQKYGKSPENAKKTFYESMKDKIWGQE